MSEWLGVLPAVVVLVCAGVVIALARDKEKR